MKTPVQKTTELTIGIFGAGNLGRVLAQALLKSGHQAGQLRLCYSGKPATRQKLIDDGLESCVRAPAEVVQTSDILLYTVRPQSCTAIAGLPFRKDAVFVSFLAGVPLDRIPVVLPISQRVRVMTSAPETILQQCGIAALFPGSATDAGTLLSTLKLRVFPLAQEDDMHAFTVFGPCLQIALTAWKPTGSRLDEEQLVAVAKKFNVANFGTLLAWAQSNQPKNLSAQALAQYLQHAATPGGVTEAILDAIASSHTLPDALSAGVARSRNLQIQSIR